jgi:hypothetical protein
MLVALVMVCALPCPAAHAQNSATVPLIEIELVFSGGGVQRGRVRDVSGAPPASFTVPQLHPLFFEVRGAKGQLTFAGVVREPRGLQRATYGVTQTTAAAPAGSESSTDHALITVPKPAEPSTLRIVRRTGFGPTGGRQVILEMGL